MYHLSITTMKRLVFDDKVYSLIAPGTSGYLEILTHHAPIITSLNPGQLIITHENNEKLFYAVSGGILEVSRNEAILLADAIESPEEIDLERAKLAYQRALEKIKSYSNDKGINLPRAKQALLRAQCRIAIYQNSRSISSKEI